MNNRLIYVDKLKGLAILFMVMGHIVQISFGTLDNTFVRFFTSFHMPIFFFLSGIYVYKHVNDYSWKEFQTFVLNKFRRIIFPFLTIGGAYVLFFKDNLLCLLDGSFGGYWFLPALFFCMLFDVILSYTIRIFYKKNNLFLDVIVRLFLWIVLIFLYHIGLTYPYYRGFIYHYLFFVFGILYNKYPYIKDTILNSNALYTICGLFYITLWSYTKNIPFGFNIIAFFSIPILLYTFNKYDKNISDKISFLGFNSLEIYVFHRFFIPSLLPFGEFLNDYQDWDYGENFILIGLSSLILAIPICILSLWLAKGIKTSKFLNYLCFGSKL